MAEMYDNTCSSPPPPHPATPRPPLDSDEISLFLHHLIHSSSSLSRISDNGKQMPFYRPPATKSSLSPQITSTAGFCDADALPCGAVPFSHSNCRARDGSSTAESSAAVDFSTLIFSSSSAYFPVERKETGNATSSGAGDCDAGTASVKRKRYLAENDLDDYDCESEEGMEAPEGSTKRVPPRTSSSKRSRAAEVHNLSEKRRRSRINEKMKALQNLIPNSNKTDKASMLDEAIEYLKQLQLQVQMLTMRNGLSLHPMYLPGVLQPMQLPQMQMGFGEGDESLHVTMGTGTLPVNQETSTQTAFSLSNQCRAAEKPVVLPSMTNITNLGTPFGMELPIQTHHRPFQLSTASEEFYREDLLPQQQLDISHSMRNPSENKMKASVLEDNCLEACVLHTQRSQEVLPNDFDTNQMLIQHLHGI